MAWTKYGFHPATNNVTNRTVNLPIGNTTWQWKIQLVQMILDSSHMLGARWDAHQLRLTAASPTHSFKYLGLIRKGLAN